MDPDGSQHASHQEPGRGTRDRVGEDDQIQICNKGSN